MGFWILTGFILHRYFRRKEVHDETGIKNETCLIVNYIDCVNLHKSFFWSNVLPAFLKLGWLKDPRVRNPNGNNELCWINELFIGKLLVGGLMNDPFLRRNWPIKHVRYGFFIACLTSKVLYVTHITGILLVSKGGTLFYKILAQSWKTLKTIAFLADTLSTPRLK